jgi:PhnB protein
MPQARMLSPQSVGGTAFQLYMYVKDVDKIFNQALKAGATVTMPVMDTFYGDRTGQLMDPFGHLWGLATHMRDIPLKEMKKAAQDWYAQMSNQ